MSVVPIERQLRRRIPRFLVRNQRWVTEARDTLPLWKQLASAPESDSSEDRAVRKRADAREEAWSSAYSAT